MVGDERMLNIVARKKSPIGTVILTVILSTNLAMAGNSSALPNLEFQQTAQNDAELKLKVVDREGALIVTAQITLEKSAKEKIVGSADSAGEWSQTKLAPGKYTLTIEARSFQTFKSEIEIHNGMIMNLQVTLPWDFKQERF